ncbi:NADH dehydrogenase [ubiquinone] 1 subunit C1, mitochondrial isoform X1 [Tachysurus fulvidraco]|uniref:NADH dehydrogenase [ubiquinone] 1 subunit C1, mitochondrial isoform X1 n=1 Tax=Tachysurus fulvidraco TaxID=1234273 RepID=UPI001FF03AAB|nr:NADH dehydrogenase [ubiquinone] 1 subunit C1, mitochondrial isoform X1 [Tachysurus fulvidraco]
MATRLFSGTIRCLRMRIDCSSLPVVSRNAFTATKPDPSKPNMLRVGMAFGTTALLWMMLFKKHWSDVQEYKTSNGLE